MRYKPPSYSQLLTLADDLKAAYRKAGGKNSQRYHFLDLYNRLLDATKTLPEAEATKILIGLAVFQLQIIEKIYKDSSAKVSKGWIYNSGSQFYTDMLEKLQVSKENPLLDDDRLTCLNKLYWHIDSVVTDDKMKDLAWKNKQVLFVEVHQYLKKLRSRDERKISTFVNGRPNLVALKKNVSKITGEYELATASRWFKNHKRLALLTFIDFVDQTCDDPDHAAVKDENINEKAKDAIYWHSYNARMGAILFVLMQIGKEYNLLSATRSEAYRKCLKAINVKNLADVKIDNKITWLKSLSLHLTLLKEMGDDYKVLTENWSLKGLSNLDQVYANLVDNELNLLGIEKVKPSRASGYMRDVIKGSAQYASGFVLSKYLAKYGFTEFLVEYALPASLQTAGLAVGAAVGPFLMVGYGIAGTIITTQLGRLVRDKLMPAAVAGVYAKIMEKTGEALGDAVAGSVVSVLGVTASGVRYLVGKEEKIISHDYLPEWIDTLLSLPSDIMPEDEKNQIRNMLGLEREPALRLLTN